MKTVAIIFLLSFVTLHSTAQFTKIPVDTTTNKVVFTEVVKADSVSKNDLYVRAKEWFVRTFKSADAVIQMDDKENGKLIGKGFSEITLPPILGNSFTTRMFYTISISIKDNKFKYEVTDIYYKSYPTAQNPSATTYPETWYVPESQMYKNNGKEKTINKGYYDKTLEAVNSLISSLKKAMSVKKDKDSDW